MTTPTTEPETPAYPFTGSPTPDYPTPMEEFRTVLDMHLAAAAQAARLQDQYQLANLDGEVIKPKFPEGMFDFRLGDEASRGRLAYAQTQYLAAIAEALGQGVTQLATLNEHVGILTHHAAAHVVGVHSQLRIISDALDQALPTIAAAATGSAGAHDNLVAAVDGLAEAHEPADTDLPGWLAWLVRTFRARAARKA